MPDQKRTVLNKPLYKVLNTLSVIILAGTFLYIIICWNDIPQELPTHFGGAGKADSWGGKGMILFTPILAVIMFGMISLLELTPDVWNTGVKLTPQNRERVLCAVKGLITTTKFALVLSFSYITYRTSKGQDLGVLYLPVFLMLIFCPMFYYLVKIFRS